MIKLDKTKVYDLNGLNEEQRIELFNWLKKNDDNWDITAIEDFNRNSENFNLVYNESLTWHWYDKSNVVNLTNAIELFYTLENVQVDCIELSKEQIKEMCRVFDSNGYKLMDIKSPLEVKEGFEYLQYWETWSSYWVGCCDKKVKHTITYEKFIELFGNVYQQAQQRFGHANIKIDIQDDRKMSNEDILNISVSTKPTQYQIGIDTFERMESNCTVEERIAFAKGNIDKYNWRVKGQDIEDFKKIIAYAEWAIKQLQ